RPAATRPEWRACVLNSRVGRSCFRGLTLVVEHELSQCGSARFSHSCLGTRKLLPHAEANALKRGQLADDRLQPGLRQRLLRLNGNHEFFLAIVIQSGEEADLVDTQLTLDCMFQRRHGNFFSLNVQNIGTTSQYTDTAVRAPDRDIARIEEAIAKRLG